MKKRRNPIILRRTFNNQEFGIRKEKTYPIFCIENHKPNPIFFVLYWINEKVYLMLKGENRYDQKERKS